MSIWLRAVAILFITLFGYAHASEQTAKQLACMDTEHGNTQCSYEVKGQEIDQPDSTSIVYAMSSMPYALCSSAVCTVSDDHPDSARCVCKVYGRYQQQNTWRKASVGPLDYAASRPEFLDGQLSTVISNFSFANFSRSNKPNQTICKSKKPLSWANCFGVRCHIVTGSNGNATIATCDCPISQTKEFASTGPKSQHACKLPKGKVWSGATEQQGDNDMAVMQDMYKLYYPDHSINRLLK